MAEKNYVGLTGLTKFLDNLKSLFATKEEVDNKASSDHNHDSAYDKKGSAATALTEAKDYTNAKLDTFLEENPVEVHAILDDDGVLYFTNKLIPDGDEVAY